MTKHSFPLDPKSGQPIRDLPQPGYYPKFSTLKQKKSWDQTTRNLVVERVHAAPEIRFFNPAEAELLQAILDRILPQDDRDEPHTIPILPTIDERLYKNELNGFRYEDMPPDREAYHLGLQAIDEMAQQQFQTPFAALPVSRQELLLKSLHDGKPAPHHPVWKQMPIHRFWAMLMEDCVTAYYSHPWSWDEIGFGGPAYPRGYMRLENGLPEPWETDESRYEWTAPADSISDLDNEGTPPAHASLHGHGGTH
ncbi:MAG: gluconate 2-dehydrogenase subunit 3 family protein [Acidobacteriaceae bacterium]